MTRLRALWFLVGLPFRAARRTAIALSVASVLDAVGLVVCALLVGQVVDAVQRGADPTALVLVICAVLALSSAAHSLAFLGQVTVAEESRQVTDLATVRSVGGRRHIDHFDTPRFMDDLQVLRRERGRIGTSAMVTFQALCDGLRLASVLAVLVWVDPVLLLLLVGAVAATWAASRAETVTAAATEAAARSRRRADALLDVAASAGGRAESSAFGSTAFLLAQHDEALAEATALERRGRWHAYLISTAGWAAFGLMYGLPLASVAVGWPFDGPPPAQLVPALILAVMLLGAVGEALGSFSWILAAATTAARYLRVVGPDLDSETAPRAEPLDRLHDGVRLDDVGFTYANGDRPTLQHVNLHLRAGEVVALVGENGAGKSTLMSLLLGAYGPGSGRIIVDGTDVAHLPEGTMCASSTGMLQDFVRYELSLGENVGVGHVDHVHDRQRVLHALDATGSSGLAELADDGLSAHLGPDGRELSGGQWQRLASARAAMRPSPVLRLFDEPTSSLDPDAEAALYARIVEEGRALGQATGAVTVIVSHRLATVATVDRVAYLEAGQVLAFGSHDDVMRACPPYARLYTLQAQGYA